MADVSTVFHVEHRGSRAPRQPETGNAIRTRRRRMFHVYIRIAPQFSSLHGSANYVDAMFHVERSFSAILRAHSPIPITNILIDGEFVPLTVNNVVNSPASSQRTTAFPIVLSHWCRNLALDQHGSLSPSSRTRLLDSGIWSGSDQRNTFPN